jgi:ATP-dependent exoDNAse (exonuclease V) alpha subunit
MRALTLAWTQDGGQVIGLAPSAAAAAVLCEQTGIRTETLAKLTWSLRHGDLPDWATGVGPATLIIIDEGWHGRHPHPRHRSPVRRRPRRECSADR